MKKLIVLFDGTWNSLEDETNVCRLKTLLAPRDAAECEQRCFYDEGVGNSRFTRLLGGVFGLGLSENVRQGYAWLISEYEPGDEVYVFGFSRGAHTARSLVGLIRKCGLLRETGRVREAYALYRSTKIGPDDPEAMDFRAQYSRAIHVKFVGVWDTVGALGIPATGVPFSRSRYEFHDTQLSKIVDAAYHALALDEHRRDYEAAVWNGYLPGPGQEVEQRWFAGAHANVGGGYGRDPLSNFPLRWMQEKAKAHGLAFTADVEVGPEDHLAPVRDSFREFLFGLYRLAKGGQRYYRPVLSGVNEVVDESVYRRMEAMPGYAPPQIRTVGA